MAHEIVKGDHVTIGDNSLTWEVVNIFQEASVYGPLASLVSGQTGRARYEAVAHLNLHTKGESL